MHTESNALQQRFSPQPVLRSSWQQLARFNKGSRRSRCCGQAGNSLRASTKVRTAAGNVVKLATAWQTKYSPLKKYLMIIIKRFVT